VRDWLISVNLSGREWHRHPMGPDSGLRRFGPFASIYDAKSGKLVEVPEAMTVGKAS
jgi:hypothetical protein